MAIGDEADAVTVTPMAVSSMATGDAADAVTIESLPADVLNAALRRLDGPSLAAATCAASRLRAAADDPDLWRGLCLSTWPSLRLLPPPLPGSHRSFFADAFPCPSLPSSPSAVAAGGFPASLISAVDLYHRGTHILSRVVRTETSSPWFLSAPFRVDAIDGKVATPAEVVSPEELALTWVLIDPACGQAAELSSRRPVAVDRRGYSGEARVRFAAVVGEGFAVAAVVTCSEPAGHVTEVGLVVEGAEGVGLGGRESLAILGEALRGGRRRAAEGEAARRYEDFERRRRRRREAKEREEGAAELVCAFVGAAVVLAFFVLVAFP